VDKRLTTRGHIFALASGHAAVQVYHLSSELDAGSEIVNHLTSMPDAKLRLADDGTATLDHRPLPECLLTEHICQALQQYRTRPRGPEAAGEQSMLLAALERRIKGRHSIGWLIGPDVQAGAVGDRDRVHSDARRGHRHQVETVAHAKWFHDNILNGS
jgi:hypothetical protein